MQFKPSFKKIILVPFIMFVVFALSNCGKKCDCSYEKFSMIREGYKKQKVESILNVESPSSEKSGYDWGVIHVCSYKCEDNTLYITYDNHYRVHDKSFNVKP